MFNRLFLQRLGLLHDTGFLPPALQTETVLRTSFRHNRSRLPSLTSTFRARAWGFGIMVLAMHLEGSMEAGMTAQLLLHVEKSIWPISL